MSEGPIEFTDCCLTVAFDAKPLLVIEGDEVDPFTGEGVGWPSPRTYWSNGLVTDGEWTVGGAFRPESESMRIET